MNVQDRVMEWWLTTLDFVLDLFTLGGWSRWQGERRVWFHRRDGGRR